MKYLLLSITAVLPSVVSAQGLQTYIPGVVAFISNTIIPFLLGIAFLLVVFNVVRYFVVESTSPDGREKAKGYILYSVFAFVFIIVFWGVINLLVSGTGLGSTPTPKTDFETKFTP